MARGTTKNGPSQERGRRSAPHRARRSCYFCRHKIDKVDYKEIDSLRRLLSERGKIRSRRVTGACRKHQAQLAKAVKLARELALLPYVGD